MIIPTPEFDPLFAHDGIPFREKMLGYIEREFADLLPRRPRISSSDDHPPAEPRLAGLAQFVEFQLNHRSWRKTA